jgi:hypothetical protein
MRTIVLTMALISSDTSNDSNSSSVIGLRQSTDRFGIPSKASIPENMAINRAAKC